MRLKWVQSDTALFGVPPSGGKGKIHEPDRLKAELQTEMPSLRWGLGQVAPTEVGVGISCRPCYFPGACPTRLLWPKRPRRHECFSAG
jgi:hypothetical protein